MARGSSHHEVTSDHVAFTVEALAAQPGDVELAKLSARIAPLLNDWDSIDRDGRLLERAVVRASAHVKVADASLDAVLSAFAEALLAAVKGDHQAPLYTRFFSEPHDDVVAMGLDSEVPEVTLIVRALDQADASVPDALRAHTETLRAGLKLGNAALAARSDALADLGRHMARVEAWHETAESTLRSMRGTLSRVAQKRGLPIQWVEAHFNTR
jgi:hypothetical protein